MNLLSISFMLLLQGGADAFAGIKNPMTRPLTTRLHYFDDISRCKMDWEESSDEMKALQQRFAQDKMEMMQRYLTGYSAKTAVKLTEEKILKEMTRWTNESGLVGIDGSDEDQHYERILGIKVCRSPTVLGCLSLVWRQISNIVEDRARIPKSEKSQAILLVIPDCPELYSYDALVTFQASLDFSAELCKHLGNDFTLQLFHPKYENKPRLLDPARHSPFPCLGVHLDGREPTIDDPLLIPKPKPMKSKYAEDSGLRESRELLETLFNSAAATSVEPIVIVDNDVRTDESNLNARKAREATERWMSLSLLEGAADKALKYAGTEEHRWTITKSTSVEEIYSDVWLAITILQQLGTKLEESKVKLDVISSMFITTKWCVYNAQTWRRFAITINGALKKISNGQMFLEVFHPEYTGKQVVSDGSRRAPLPTIQICYRLKQKKKQLKSA